MHVTVSRLGASLALATLAVAGCSHPDTGATSTSTSSTTATIAAPGASSSPMRRISDTEQAVAEARAAYQRYRQVTDAVFQRGGTKAKSELETVAVGDQLNYLLREAANFEAKRIRAVGSARIRSLRVAHVHLTIGKLPQVVLRICDDASGNDAVDRSGRSVRKSGALRNFIEVVTLTRIESRGWLVSQEDDTPVKSC